MQQMRIIDTTLREGEQFAEAHFTSAQKRRIARALDAFGVDYIEVTSPAASSRSSCWRSIARSMASSIPSSVGTIFPSVVIRRRR